MVDDLSGGFRENVNPAAVLIEGSVTDTILIDSLFATQNIDYVYHIAAYAAEGLVTSSAATTIRTTCWAA